MIMPYPGQEFIVKNIVKRRKQIVPNAVTIINLGNVILKEPLPIFKL